ncbi:aminopeptidase P family protein [Candidatus Woesearchaeota archaeon]|nr:aminopeptidase P family protein [Candidatus Woesearchaeota archaeon]
MAIRSNVSRFQDMLRARNMGYALLQNIDGHAPSGNFFYLCNYNGLGVLIIPADGKPLLLVAQMEYERAKDASSVPVAIMKRKLPVEIAARFSRRMLHEKRLGLDYDHTSMAQQARLRKYVRSSFVDVAELCQTIRLRKTPSEIEKIQRACMLTDKTFQKTFDVFDSFRTEADIAAFMLQETARFGCEPSFRPIVASGTSGARPHYEVKQKKLCKGFCIIDYGIRYQGYCADMTRTVFLGKPTKHEQAAYAAVFAAHDAARGVAVPGCSFASIEKVARQRLGKYSKNFIHSIGHGLGVDVHEYPFVHGHHNKSFTQLGQDTVFTIEPGVYYPKRFGIRIEDDYVMTKKGPQALTKSSRSLLVLR